MKIMRSLALHLVVAVLLVGTLTILYLTESIPLDRAMYIGKKSLMIIAVFWLTISAVKILYKGTKRHKKRR